MGPAAVRASAVLLSDAERQRASRFGFDRDAHRFIAARSFSHRENEAYRDLDPRDKLLGFYNCWTRKEAFVKALGDGLSHRLDRFDVSLAPSEPAMILRVDQTPGDSCSWRLESFSPAPGFVGAVVAECQRSRAGFAPPQVGAAASAWAAGKKHRRSLCSHSPRILSGERR